MVGFTWLDYGILAFYIAGVTVLGSLFSRGQRNPGDFFLAGRSMRWLPMTLSVIATDFSAISFLGVPGYVVDRDLLLQIEPLLFIWVLPLTMYLFVKFFYRLGLISAYEYLERRFNVSLRTSCSLLFICLRLSWMSTALYATALALTQVTNLPFWGCVIAMGVFTTIYSALGGMKAVIWTDVAQFFVFTFAILLVLIKCIVSIPGGMSKIWQTASLAGHTRLFHFEGGLREFNTQAVIVGGTFLLLISYGVDQIIIQRYLTARSIDQIKHGMVFQVFFQPVLVWALALIGLSVFSYYAYFPDRLPAGVEPDKWFPYFLVHELPAGVSGIVVAGLLAATMSSISSGVNSLTAASMVDFYRRFFVAGKQYSKPAALGAGVTHTAVQDLHELRLSQILTVVWGLAATGLALVVGKIGVIAVIAKTLSGFFGGVLLGVFLLGIVVPRANGTGVLLGAIIGFLTISVVGLASSINLFWYAPIGCIVTIFCGLFLSCFFPAPPREKLYGLTLKTN